MVDGRQQYRQRVPAAAPKEMTPEEFDALREEAIEAAYEELAPEVQVQVFERAKGLREIMRNLGEELSFRDALQIVGAIAAWDASHNRGTAGEPVADGSIFFANPARDFNFNDLNHEQLTEMCALKFAEISRIYDVNATIAKQWRAKARFKTHYYL